MPSLASLGFPDASLPLSLLSALGPSSRTVVCGVLGLCPHERALGTRRSFVERYGLRFCDARNTTLCLGLLGACIVAFAVEVLKLALYEPEQQRERNDVDGSRHEERGRNRLHYAPSSINARTCSRQSVGTSPMRARS